MECPCLLREVMVRLPDATPAETFRMAMLLSHHAADDERNIDQRIQDLTLQLALYDDQHSAIAEELDGLASTEPCHFNVQHLWTLIRAIKVQSQLLNLYLGSQTQTAACVHVTV